MAHVRSKIHRFDVAVIDYGHEMRTLGVTVAAALITLLPVSSAQAQESAAPRNVGITGMWLGTNSGYENGVYTSREVRYSITGVTGVAITGTKSWRQVGGEWSEPEQFQGVLYKSGDFHAVDDDGYFLGRLVTPTKIRGTYLEAGEDQSALVVSLTKASRQ